MPARTTNPARPYAGRMSTSVREGLFLITPNFRLGSQLSQSAHTLFGRKLASGDDFFTLPNPRRALFRLNLTF